MGRCESTTLSRALWGVARTDTRDVGWALSAAVVQFFWSLWFSVVNRVAIVRVLSRMARIAGIVRIVRETKRECKIETSQCFARVILILTNSSACDPTWTNKCNTIRAKSK